jgi:hypothetical protein
MTITKQTALNEILIRLADDGSVAGAHVVEIEHLTDTATGEILSSRLLPARGITAAEVGDLLGAANAGLLEQIDALRADLAAMTKDRDDEKAAKDAALSGKLSAEAQRDQEAAAKNAALAQVASLTADLAAETAAKQEAMTGKAEAENAKAQADAARDMALAEKSGLEAQIAALTARIEELTAEPPPSADPSATFAAAIQAHIDATAKARGYADGVAAVSYKFSTVPAWAAEAATFLAWRDAVWVYAYSQLAAVQTGARDMPDVATIIGELPAIVWPA